MEPLKEIQIKHRRDRSDVVKVSFSSTYQYIGTDEKNLRCHIVIGNKIIDMLQWKVKDYISIFQGEHPHILSLRKKNIKENYKNKFMLQHVKNYSFHQLSIPFFRVITSKKIRTVPHEVIEMEDGNKYLKVFFEGII